MLDLVLKDVLNVIQMYITEMYDALTPLLYINEHLQKIIVESGSQGQTRI